MINRLQQIDRKQRQTLLRIAAHVGSLIPLIWLYLDYYTYNLGPDEIRAAILLTGKPALILLILSLAVTPAMALFGWKMLQPLRRIFGLYAFFYVSLHFTIFAVIDYGLDLRVVWGEIVDRQYALFGFAAFLLMIPLAATSNKWAQRKLGKKWKPLHRAAYAAGLLAVIHYIWLVKQDYNDPLFYALLLLALFILRLTPIKKSITSLRRRLVYRFSQS